jgi:hypothetical protein
VEDQQERTAEYRQMTYSYFWKLYLGKGCHWTPYLNSGGNTGVQWQSEDIFSFLFDVLLMPIFVIVVCEKGLGCPSSSFFVLILRKFSYMASLILIFAHSPKRTDGGH